MTLEIVDRRGNLALVQDSERAFPGLLVQGDTMASLLEDLVDELPNGFSTQVVKEWLARYEEMMKSAGRPLPYLR